MTSDRFDEQVTSSYENYPPPHVICKAFLKRRLHSIAGLFFVLFLCEHLLTNSEAALFISEDGAGFIRMVKLLHYLPYLPAIELFLLGVPITIHAILGIQYLYEAQCNSRAKKGNEPYLPFARNFAFTWQRITSVILVVGVIAHVLTMRFIYQPVHASGERYALQIKPDSGIVTLAPRLKTTLVTPESKPYLLKTLHQKKEVIDKALLLPIPSPILATKKTDLQLLTNEQNFINDLAPTKENWIAITPDFGTAILLLVRQTMSNVWLCVLYSLFVGAATFHAANGLWTFAISWGISLNESGRVTMRRISNLLGFALLFGGLACIWLTYWVTLRS